MAVMAGYKQTEVGVIPEDWGVVQLNEVAERITVGFVGSMAHLFRNGGVPLLRGQNVLAHKLDLSDTKYISTNTHKLWKKSSLRSGDVVMVRVGYPGTSCVIPDDLGAANAASLLVASPTTRKLDSHFLCYVVNSEFGRRQIDSHLVGGAQQVLNTTTAAIFQLPLPSKPEQEAIVEALSDADALIESLEQLISKKRHIKQGAMQELLTGNKRLSGFSGEWEMKLLGDIAEVRDGTHQTPKYVESGVPFFSVEHVTSGDFSNTKFISEVEHRFLTKSFKIEKGDILMTRIGSIGDCKLIDWDVDASFYVSLALLKIRKGHSPSFICHYSKSAFFQKEVGLNSLQSAIPKKINLGPISNVKIKIPRDINEQTSIATILTEMGDELAALETKLIKIRALKQGMMHNLLTGKIRLI